jgi:class 3 adenylate cyclase
MAATREPFFIVALGDRDSFGFDEHALLPLVALVDAHTPDHRDVTNRGVMVYFRASAEALKRTRDLVNAAAQLRKREEFASLGIGIASGPLISDLPHVAPIGTPANDASRLSAGAPDAYLGPLNALLHEYRLV